MTYTINTTEQNNIEIIVPSTRIKNSITKEKYENTLNGIYRYTEGGVKKQITPLCLYNIILNTEEETITVNFNKDEQTKYTITTNPTLYDLENEIEETLPATYFISGSELDILDIINLLLLDIYNDEEVQTTLESIEAQNDNETNDETEELIPLEADQFTLKAKIEDTETLENAKIIVTAIQGSENTIMTGVQILGEVTVEGDETPVQEIEEITDENGQITIELDTEGEYEILVYPVGATAGVSYESRNIFPLTVTVTEIE